MYKICVQTNCSSQRVFSTGDSAIHQNHQTFTFDEINQKLWKLKIMIQENTINQSNELFNMFQEIKIQVINELDQVGSKFQQFIKNEEQELIKKLNQFQTITQSANINLNLLHGNLFEISYALKENEETFKELLISKGKEVKFNVQNERKELLKFVQSFKFNFAAYQINLKSNDMVDQKVVQDERQPMWNQNNFQGKNNLDDLSDSQYAQKQKQQDQMSREKIFYQSEQPRKQNYYNDGFPPQDRQQRFQQEQPEMEPLRGYARQSQQKSSQQFSQQSQQLSDDQPLRGYKQHQNQPQTQYFEESKNGYYDKMSKYAKARLDDESRGKYRRE